jgi:hypothetical protein
MPTIHDLLGRLWEDYAAQNPQVQRIHRLLQERGETVVNDHIALRTYDDARVGIEVLAAPFIHYGYRPADDYTFPEKKLFARHYEHDDETLPKVFISELKLAACSPGLREIVGRLVDQIPPQKLRELDCPAAGRLWELGYEDYEALASESEYAAWVAAFGFRANHFTVLINALQSFEGLAELNAFLKEAGFRLNDSGGEIKGSPGVYLEQSSTLADQVKVSFSDRAQEVPGCYYEFARRYRLPEGVMFHGFVARSAEKIFESTDRR